MSDAETFRSFFVLFFFFLEIARPTAGQDNNFNARMKEESTTCNIPNML